jgi:hypothetical protein
MVLLVNAPIALSLMALSAVAMVIAIAAPASAMMDGRMMLATAQPLARRPTSKFAAATALATVVNVFATQASAVRIAVARIALSTSSPILLAVSLLPPLPASG